MIRFEINEDKIENMEVIELGNRSKLPQSIWWTNYSLIFFYWTNWHKN
jgi:hypothetical protein